MGLTKSSMGSGLLTDTFETLKNKNGYTIALAGNPNVGKSTIFNNLTGMHQHTGNWPGKTVANATGNCTYQNTNFLFVDIPGTYSIMSHSEEEEIARDYICFGNPDATVVVVDATCLERNLNLVFQIMEITDNIIVCVNLLDEAKKKKIKIDLEQLSLLLGVPVVGTVARNKHSLDNLMKTIHSVCSAKTVCTPHRIKYSSEIETAISDLEQTLKEHASHSNLESNCFRIPKNLYRWISLKILDNEPTILQSIEKHLSISFINNPFILEKKEEILDSFSKMENPITATNFKDSIVSCIMKQAEKICQKVCTFENPNYSSRDRKIDKILTSKKFGFPLMLLFLGLIFWLTIVGANYPSQVLFAFFSFIQEKLFSIATILHFPAWLSDMLILGVYQTLTWVISVMLPPMAIFFHYLLFWRIWAIYLGLLLIWMDFLRSVVVLVNR